MTPAAWARESARTWPARGDVWVGLGERIEVRRAAVRVDGQNGVDLLITKGDEVRAVWAPYAEFARCTRGMTLDHRRTPDPIQESRQTAASALGAFVGGMAGLWAVWSLWGPT